MVIGLIHHVVTENHTSGTEKQTKEHGTNRPSETNCLQLMLGPSAVKCTGCDARTCRLRAGYVIYRCVLSFGLSWWGIWKSALRWQPNALALPGCVCQLLQPSFALCLSLWVQVPACPYTRTELCLSIDPQLVPRTLKKKTKPTNIHAHPHGAVCRLYLLGAHSELNDMCRLTETGQAGQLVCCS